MQIINEIIRTELMTLAFFTEKLQNNLIISKNVELVANFKMSAFNFKVYD